MFFISAGHIGTDTAYLTDAAQVQEMTPAAGSYCKESAINQPDANGNTFAYVAASVGVGDGKDMTLPTDTGAGGMFGTAFYLGQTGTIPTSTNSFPAPDRSRLRSVSLRLQAACAAQSGPSVGAGSIKFSLYGEIAGTVSPL